MGITTDVLKLSMTHPCIPSIGVLNVTNVTYGNTAISPCLPAGQGHVGQAPPALSPGHLKAQSDFLDVVLGLRPSRGSVRPSRGFLRQSTFRLREAFWSGSSLQGKAPRAKEGSKCVNLDLYFSFR